MDIMTDTTTRRTLITLFDDSAALQDFSEFLSQSYDLLPCSSAEACLQLMQERYTEISAVVTDVKHATADGFTFMEKARATVAYETTPIIIACTEHLTDEDALCLQEGAAECVMTISHPALITRRIDNAIRLKRSTTFFEIESMLRELPSNIFLKDAEGRYVFCTHYWHHLDTGDDPNWTIRGKTDLEIRKDRENAIKAMEADKEIIRTGKGTTYVIEINTDGIQEFMELIKQPVFDDEGNVSGIIALINDVTEAELLKRELEKRTRTDELTGLGNHRAYDQFVSTISNQSDFPIAVISADCDELKIINDTLGHLVGDEYIRMAAMIIKDTLPESAHVFRTGGDEFIAFLPKTTEEDAQGFVSKMRTTAGMFVLKDRKVSISYGTSFIGCADENVYDAISYADQAMYSNKAEHKRARR